MEEKSKLDYFIDRTDERLGRIEDGVESLKLNETVSKTQVKMISFIISSLWGVALIVLGFIFS